MFDRSLSLTDGVIVLRPPVIEDAPGLYQAVRESIDVLAPWMSWATEDYSESDTVAWIEKQPDNWLAKTNYNFLIFDTTGEEIVGGCGLNQVDWFYRLANLGYWIRSSQRGGGIAARAASLVTRFGFEGLGLVRVEVVVSEENQASLRVAEKLGAHKEGILRNRISVGGRVGEAVMHSLVPGDYGLPMPS